MAFPGKTESTDPTLGAEALFARYHVGWERRDPDLIASLHSEDTSYWLHDGSAPVRGREALRQLCIGMFARFPFSFELQRSLFGARYWVLEWVMVMPLKDTAGQPFTARVEMLDVVDVNDAGEVTRKDVYMNGAQSQAAFARAGIAPGQP